MAFDPTQNAADPNGGINPQQGDDSAPQQQAPQAAAPAADSTPPSGQPAQAPPQAKTATPPGSPQTTKELFHHMSHSFAGAILSGLAGQAPTQYVVDENGKTVRDPNQKVDTSGDKLRRFASTALAGLAAGASAPPSKTPGSAAWSGFGAGVNSAQQSAQKQDAGARKQATDDYEQQQQTLLRKHDIARANLLQYTTTIHMLNEQQDRDPEIKKNNDIVSALKDEGHDVTFMSDAELQARQKSDPHFMTTHHMIPLGTEPVMGTDANGSPVPVMDEVGNPKLKGKIAVVEGVDNEGKFVPPPSFIADAQKYAPLSGGSNVDSLQAGHPISMEDFARLHGAILDGKKQEHQGWVKPEVGFVGEGMDRHQVEINTVTGETRVPKAQLNIEDKPASQASTAAKNASDVTKNNAEADRARAGAAKDRSEIAQNNQGGNAGLIGEEYLKTLDPGTAGVIRAINEGRDTRSARQLQDKNGNPTPLAKQLHQAFPDFDITKTENFAKVRKDFSNPNGTGGQITAFGTVLNHMRNLYDNSVPESLIPGTEAHRKIEVDTHNVAVEMANALTTHGKAAEAEIKDQEKALSAWTPAGRRQKIQEAVRLLDGKLSERENQWKNAAPSATFAPPMPGISDEAKSNADYVLSGGKKSQSQGPKAQGPSPSTPHNVVVNGRIIGTTTDGKTMTPIQGSN